MSNSVHFSSNKHDYETPQDFFDGLNSKFKFTLDVCATHDNAKCKEYFTIETNGLEQEWTGRCWMNPPYGRETGKWMEKAYKSSLSGTLVVCLVPSRTDTKWFHEYAMKGEITFIRGRLKFGNSKNSAPFPSAIVIFRPSKMNELPPNNVINSDREGRCDCEVIYSKHCPKHGYIE